MRDYNLKSMYMDVDELSTLLRPPSSLYCPLFVARTNFINSLLSNESFLSTDKHLISSVLTCYEENLPQPHFLFQVLPIFSAYRIISQELTCCLWFLFPHASWIHTNQPFTLILLLHQNSSVKVPNDLYIVESNSKFSVFMSFSLSVTFDAHDHSCEKCFLHAPHWTLDL